MTALENPNVTSLYARRKDPITGAPGVMHYGVDSTDSKGNRNVRAIWDTIKTEYISGYNGGRGNTAYLYYSNTLRKLDQHLESFSKAVLNRQPLKQGDSVGIYGKTGARTGLHLHEEVQVYNGVRWVPVEPYKYIELKPQLGKQQGNNNLDNASDPGTMPNGLYAFYGVGKDSAGNLNGIIASKGDMARIKALLDELDIAYDLKEI